MRQPSEAQRIGAEFLATFLLTFVAAGADMLEAITNGGIGHVARYAAPALVVMAMIYSLSAVSGAHLNPAVTVAFFARRCFPARRIPGYLLAQFAGAIAAAALLRLLLGAAIERGVTRPALGFSDAQAFVAETVLTFFLVYVILATSQEKAVVGKNSGFAVAGVVAVCGLAFSPISGASMNPARSLGPMIVAGQLDYSWLYLTAPLLGAIIAAGVVWLLHGPPNEGERKGGGGEGQEPD